MGDKVIDALDHRFIDRMREWARETVLPSASNVPSSFPIDGPRGDGGAFGSRPPCGGRVMQGRVHDTNQALAELDEQHARECQAVKQYWLYEGRSLREHARRRQIDDHTFATWCIKGHELLRDIFGQQSARWHLEHDHKKVVQPA